MQIKGNKNLLFFSVVIVIFLSLPILFSIYHQHNKMDGDNLLIPILVGVIILIAVTIFFIGCWFIRKRRKYKETQILLNFSATEGTILLSPRSQINTEHTQTDDRSMILTCHFYLRTTDEYTFHSPLPQLGSISNKNWFFLTHKAGTLSVNTGSHLLTFQPKSDRLNQLNDEESAVAYIKTLNNLFNRLYHPYIEPINKLDILYAQKLLVTVKQYQRSGSLKDLIQNVTPTTPYEVNK
jgi:hypothetical protein